ncbi:MAG: hypothetical protein R3344_00475 [Acidobacteriota bacterium]|nr:hypothetical protein [Acidobacteriota bacterium]
MPSKKATRERLDPTATQARDPRPLMLIGLFALLLVGVCALIWATERPPIDDWGNIGIEGFKYRTKHNHASMGVLALVTAVAVVVYFVLSRRDSLRRKRWWRPLTIAVPLALVVVATLLYFYGSRVSKLHYPWFHDSYHYFLGAKYFPELGYAGLYECHLLADSQRPNRRFAPTDPVTDLRDDVRSVVWKTEARADCGGFTRERWGEFHRDLTFFDLNTRKEILTDRGYNGSPLHTVIATRIANFGAVTYERLLALTFVDIAGILAMFAAIAWAFGWRIGCLFALFFMVNFADRFNFVGASFLRYLWMIALGTGVAMMKKGRYGVAAVLMTAAAMLHVFPLLFFAGIGVKIVSDLVARRGLRPEYRTFVVWAVIATLVLGFVSLAPPSGIDTYGDFLSAISKHSRALTNMRVGFQYDFLFRGEIMASDPPYAYDDKAAELQQLRPLYYPIVAVIAILGLLVARRLDDVSATVLAGVLLFFLLFGTVTYYYAVVALLVLLWHEQAETPAALLFPAVLFALTAVIFWLWYLTDNNLKFLNNTAMSAMLTIYLGALLAHYVNRYRAELLPWRDGSRL